MHRFFPFAFTGLGYLYQRESLMLYNLVNSVQISRLGPEFLPELSSVYDNLLNAMESQDLEYLSGIFEPKLFKATEQSYESLKRLNLTLRLVRDESAPEVTAEIESKVRDHDQALGGLFYGMGSQHQHPLIDDDPAYFKVNVDARGVFGPKIDRQENETVKWLPIPKISRTPRKYYLNLQNPWSIVQNQILVLNVLIQTSKKLVAVNTNTQLFEHGPEDLQSQQFHKLRIETYAHEMNWVITDIDDFLIGNPYI